MGLFGTSPADTEVEKATSEQNETEKWDLILDVCDKAGKSSEEAKNYLKAILKRLNHSDPHVAVQAATLLDACVNNSGKTFHVEVASRDFENEYERLLKKSHPLVTQKLKESLKKWSEGEFKTDSQLNLIPSLYVKLKNRGVDFSSTEIMPAKKSVSLSKDPNVVQSQEEEDQIVKAIELSLKETSGSPRSSAVSASTSLYPSTNLGNLAAVTPAKEPRKVRALYNFEAAEDNELTFNSGEIIFVLDDSDPNWWKGSNQRGEGLFPANFVTADLSVEPDQFLFEEAKKSVEAKEAAEAAKYSTEPEVVEINEEKIDRLLHLLHEADPTNLEQDPEELLNLEREVNMMGPLIDAELEKVDRKHAQLTQLSADLVDALGLYHTLMREPQFPPVNKVPYGFPQTSQPQPSSMIYNGSLPPNMPIHHHQPVAVGHPHFTSGGTLPAQHHPPQDRPGFHQNVPHSHTLPPQQFSMGGPSSVPPGSQSIPIQTLPQHPPHLPDDRRMHPDQQPNTMQYPPGMYPPANFQSTGPLSLQGVPPQGHFPPTSNMHIM